MKKSLKITLIVMFVLLLSFTKVWASNASITLTPSKTTAKAGETITVKVLVKCETGIEAMDSTLKYNKNQLKLGTNTVNESYQNLSGENASTGEYKLSFLYENQEAPKTVEIVELSFTVLEDVNVGDTIEISLSNIQINDSEDEWLEIGSQTTTVKVVEGTTGGEQNGNVPSEGEQDGNVPSEGEQDGNVPSEGEQNGNTSSGGKQDGNTSSGNNTTKDNTTSKAPLSYAGLGGYMFAIIAGVILVAAVAYSKYKQYKNI